MVSGSDLTARYEPVLTLYFMRAVLEGSVRITALDYEGGNFIDDLQKGDLWYFPSGVPHSLQGLSPNGSEFLLVFDDGHFSEESTFILTDWLGRSPWWLASTALY